MKANERDEILKKYITMKAQASDIEGELSLMRDQIMEQIPSGMYGEFIVAIEEMERVSFSLKEAKAKLSPAMREKLKPFIKKIEYQTLKVIKLVK